MAFQDQVAVVTGGASGIGFAIAEHLGARGAKICVFDVSQEALDAAAAKFKAANITAMGLNVDVGSATDVESAMAQVAKAYGTIHILVQAAGITGVTGVKCHEVDPANFDLVQTINVKGIFLCAKFALPYMLKQDYGRICNIASVSGKEGNPGQSAYASSKAAVIGLTKVWGKEYAETGITVNAVAPAVVATPMVAAMPKSQVDMMTSKIPMKRTGELNEMASLCGYICSKECSFTTAFCFDATGGRSTY